MNEYEQLSFNINLPQSIKKCKTTTKNIAKKIYEDTEKIKDEIVLRRGYFYSNANTDLKLTDIENLLLARYENNEITHKQLKKIIQTYKLDIPFINNKSKFDKLIERLSPYNSYSCYDCSTSETYYNVLEVREFNYDQIVNTIWATKDKYTKEKIQEIKELAKKHTFNKDDITISVGIDCNEYFQICLYKSKSLIGYFHSESDYYKNIEKLFKYEKIDIKYIKLVDLLKNRLDYEKQEENKKHFNKFKNNAKYTFKKGKECYMLHDKICENKGDVLRCFINYEKISEYHFEENHTMGTLEFEKDLVKRLPKELFLKDAKTNNIKLSYIDNMINNLNEFAFKYRVKKNAEKDKQYRQQRDSYSNYDFNNLFNSKPKYSSGEKEKLKKIYKTLAIKFHPDMPNGDPEIMKLVNKLKEEWGI